jgi:hypothetical protein
VIGRTFIVAALAAFGLWLLVPGRNVVGNPKLETLKQECHGPDGSAFRFYVGDAGAMVAPWYTVTYEPSAPGRERQIFNSYRRPAIDSLRCERNSVLLTSREGDVRLSYARVRTVFFRRPLLYYDRRLDDQAIQPLRVVELVLGVSSLLTAGFLVLRSARGTAA